MMISNKNFVRKIEGNVKIMEHTDWGIISIRYRKKRDLSNIRLQKVIGTAIPTTNEILFLKDGSLAWMSTDELWFLANIETKDKIFKKLFKNDHTVENILPIDISASRTFFSLNGTQWRNVIAKGSPADVSKNVFKPGNIRRTRLGLVAVAFFCIDSETAILICNRSVKDYVFDWLEAAAKDGSIPNYF